MTEPLFKQGDKVTIPGRQGVWIIGSWPATNEGRFVIEQFNPQGNVAIRDTPYYGADRDGEPVDSAVVPVLYDGPDGGELMTTKTLEPWAQTDIIPTPLIEEDTDPALVGGEDADADLPADSDPADADADAAAVKGK